MVTLLQMPEISNALFFMALGPTLVPLPLSNCARLAYLETENGIRQKSLKGLFPQLQCPRSSLPDAGNNNGSYKYTDVDNLRDTYRYSKDIPVASWVRHPAWRYLAIYGE